MVCDERAPERGRLLVSRWRYWVAALLFASAKRILVTVHI
jgi:hypothetical protein